LVQDLRSKGKTILLTTHFMEEAERLCDRVAILDHGRIVALDTPAALIRSLGAEERVIFSIDGTMPSALEKALSAVGRLEIQGERVVVHGNAGRQIPLVSEIVSQLVGSGVHFRDLRTEQPNLEDVFLKLTGHEMRE
jgi:ABC-2 type transport system ATP-binding protein